MKDEKLVIHKSDYESFDLMIDDYSNVQGCVTTPYKSYYFSCINIMKKLFYNEAMSIDLKIVDRGVSGNQFKLGPLFKDRDIIYALSYDRTRIYSLKCDNKICGVYNDVS